MNISLRQKTLKDGRISLFLDYYLPKARQTRKKESLKLYLHPSPRTKIEKEHNKKTLILAESIRSKQLLKLQHDEHGFSHLIKDKETTPKKSIVAYFKEQTRKRTGSSYGIWKSALQYIIKYVDSDHVSLSDIDKEWVEGFKLFLQTATPTSSKTTLSSNTAHIYFSKFKTTMRQAYKDKLLDHNPCEDVVHIDQQETEREFLTLEELMAVSKTTCQYPHLKKAFLFSTLTGLRKSDILKMKWSEVQYSEKQGWYIRFTQKKTKKVETLPIPKQARNLLGECDDKDSLVFKGLKLDSYTSYKLKVWMLESGITKKITFHCARHTFATLQLTMGTDIYTVSNLLGHKGVKTTQIYAQIIDQKKVEAVNRIPNLTL
jgi:integrase